MSEPVGNPFRDGRANLRETAKWMVSGAVGAATLIVGSSTISQLGGMEADTPRFWVAMLALILAASLCWFPFIFAINVLRSELYSLSQFTAATKGDFKAAIEDVSKILGKLPEGVFVRDFVAQYPALRSKAWSSSPDTATRDKAVADLENRFQMARELCISQLVEIRFSRLVNSIRFPGALIVVLFLVFTWAANPPKDAIKIYDKPLAEALTPERMARLKDAKVAPGCYGQGAQLVAIGAPDAGPQTAILTPPPANAAACPPRKVTLSADRILKVD
ncbi:MAG TPA: hypothetical protein VFW13_15035 [Phenylobacterium sp.]|nr:hypothetical protein [Phenylobacterium sp.]